MRQYFSTAEKGDDAERAFLCATSFSPFSAVLSYVIWIYMHQKLCSLFLFLFFSCALLAQDIDVQHYRFEINLADETNAIEGRATIQLQFLQPVQSFALDLAGPAYNKGMKLGTVSGPGVLRYEQKNDKVWIHLQTIPAAGSTKTFTINYSGVPADGLIISTNRYGDRTFFADNWPNRAHQWIPCHDTPADKASVEFIVTAPPHYQVISNGLQVEETLVEGHKKRTHWKEEIPISTKVMVIGAAHFAIRQYHDSTCRVSVTAWVYPQDQDKGFEDFAPATGILQFFTNYIGPYPFEKLANVQSTTIFGGMENASAIFYAENVVTGTRRAEALIAHEVAHQWFGNMATEKSFAHLWLSEGFATYLAHLYLEQQYGHDTLLKRLQEDRREVIAFSKRWNRPVVDSVSDLMDLLNANSYQKGGWVLHLLRQEVGDSLFKNIIQTYYQQYKGRNADTWDFKRVAETVSGKDLTLFFNQWLFQSRLPRLEVKWRSSGQDMIVTVKQTQAPVFQFPLQLGITTEKGNSRLETLTITRQDETFKIPIAEGVKQVALDPQVRLLFEGSLQEVK